MGLSIYPSRCPVKQINQAGELICVVMAVDDVRLDSITFAQVIVACFCDRKIGAVRCVIANMFSPPGRLTTSRCACV